MVERKTLMLIDFNNVFYSHYYGKPIFNSKGQNIHGIQGFIFRMKNLREMFNPDYIVLARDVSRIKTFRRELYSEYKNNRKPTDNDFIFQSSAALRIFSLMGYPILGHERYEADDIIGMCSLLADELNMDTIIVSADKDLYQLISPHTSIFSFKVGELIDMTYMNDVYKLTPSQWVDLKILQGDKSDNIPGIQSIGHKTALALMQGFGSIANIYQHLDRLSDSMRNKFELGKADIPLTRTLVTIIRDYKLLDITEKTFERSEMFVNELFNELAELELAAVVNTIRYNLMPITINNPDNFVMSY